MLSPSARLKDVGLQLALNSNAVGSPAGSVRFSKTTLPAFGAYWLKNVQVMTSSLSSMMADGSEPSSSPTHSAVVSSQPLGWLSLTE